jgi:hypothetical protein
MNEWTFFKKVSWKTWEYTVIHNVFLPKSCKSTLDYFKSMQFKIRLEDEVYLPDNILTENTFVVMI